MRAPFKFTVFDESLLEPAADLLAARHARDVVHQPLLPRRFNDPAVARTALATLWLHEHTSGVAAWQNGRLAGYLVGEIKIDTFRGRSVWLQLPGQALAEDQPAELLADLYAEAAPQWLRWGAFSHYVMIPAADEAGQAVWFSLSFGQEQAVALRALQGPLPTKPDLPGLEVRLVTRSDEKQLVEEMAPLLSSHMSESPVWGVALPEYDRVRRAGYSEMLADEDVYIWGAFEQGHMLAYQIYLPVTQSDEDMIVPKQCCLLELAATRPEARGRGIGQALLARGLAHARQKGDTTCLLDWRTTNREARRFWLDMGFQPVAYRLVRQVDSRIAWAHW